MRRGAASLITASLLGACGFSVSGSPPVDENTSGQRVVTDDTAADFMAGTLTEGTVATRGAIEPAGYVTGGLHARSYAQPAIASNSSFDAITLPAQVGERWGVVPGNFDITMGRPRGLGLTNSDNYTLMLDGEIHLPAGSVTVQVASDDEAMMQISLDHGATWGDIARDAADSQVGMLVLPISTAGWYPIRIGFDDQTANAVLYLTINGTAVTDADLRAPVTDAHGVLVSAFQHFVFLNPLGESSYPSIDQDFGAAAPALDLGLTGDVFVLRYSGQLRIDTQADYTFTADIEATDYYRVFVDGAVAIQNYTGLVTPSATLSLAPGWHDITYDFSEINQTAHARLIVSGGDLSGPVPTDRLRPVVASGLVTAGLETTQYPIADAGSAPSKTEVQLAPGKPREGAITTVIDWGFNIDAHTPLTDVVVDLECPTPVRAAFDASGDGLVLSSAACAGMPTPDDVTFRITDSTMGGTPGYVFNMYAGVTYRGGRERQPFPLTTTFVSSVKPMPGATAWGAVGLVADPRAATITLEVRAAADEAALESAAWVVVSDGQVPQMPIGELAQYRITIENDGWQLASVDRVELRYIGP